jgi:hypothetical protein
MKTLVAAGVSGLLMLGVASQASASFNQGDLVFSVYDTNVNQEIGADLGSMGSIQSLITSGAQNVVLASGLNFSGMSSQYGDMGVYMDNSNPGNATWEGWFAVTKSNYSAKSINALYTNGTTFSSNYTQILEGYNANLTSSTTAQVQATSADSYKKMMDYTTAAGYAGINKTAGLAGLLPSTGNSTTLYLYHFASNAADQLVLADPTYDATIQVNSNGSIVFSSATSPVPVPGAALLLGSALAGIAGIRRRMNS